MNLKQRAFSLIELVLVMLIIGILSVSVVPRFFGQSEISHITVRDRIIAQLRLVQLQAMNQLNRCNRITFTTLNAGIEGKTETGCTGIDLARAIDLNGVTVTKGSSQNFSLTFDGQGRVAVAPGTTFSQIQLSVIGSETSKIYIESQGYIHAL